MGLMSFQGKHLKSIHIEMTSSAGSSNFWKAPIVSIVRSKKEGNRTPKTEQEYTVHIILTELGPQQGFH